MRESKRNNRPYRQHALKYLGDFAGLRDSVDMFSTVYSIVEPVLQEALSDDGDMDVDSSSVGGASSKTMSALSPLPFVRRRFPIRRRDVLTCYERSRAEQTVANAFGALFQCIHPRARSVPGKAELSDADPASLTRSRWHRPGNKPHPDTRDGIHIRAVA